MRLAMRRIHPGSGWGNTGEGIERALEARGVEVVPHDVPAPAQLHILPPHFYTGHHAGSVPWCFTMWETDTAPEGLTAGLGNFEGIIVPTDENHLIFSAEHPNVHKVNLGVDHQTYTAAPRELNGPFRWMYTAHSPHRKGGDVAEKAARILRDNGYEFELVPAVAGSDDELRDLYHSCHAYLQPSRGEGWGMMPHQALATGMPVVISDCLGHRDYAWLPGCYLTDTNLVPAELDFNGPAGCWWEPVVASVVERMAWVMDNYSEAHSEAQKAPGMCSVYFDWGSVADEIINLIGEDVLNAPTPADCWVPAKWKTYPVVALRNVDCEIGDSVIKIRQGETAHLWYDQKRNLVKSGAVEAA